MSDYGVEVEALRDALVNTLASSAERLDVFANPAHPHQIVYIDRDAAAVFLVTVERASITPVSADGPG